MSDLEEVMRTATEIFRENDDLYRNSTWFANCSNGSSYSYENGTGGICGDFEGKETADRKWDI